MVDPGTAAIAALKAKARWRPIEIAIWLAALGGLFFAPRSYLLLNEIAILALFALSLDLILGYAGIVSLGHAAFFGFGAYAAALIAKHIGGEPVLGLVAAGLGAGVLGLVSSPLIMRGSDLTRLMVTLGLGLLLLEVANRAAWLTGGADGLQGVTVAPILGRFEFDLFGRTAYVYSLAVLFVMYLAARRVAHSPFGRSLTAIRDNPLRARAIGVPVERRIATVYTIAAAMAGVAGGLLAQTTQFASLDALEFHRSADVLLVLVIGGAGRLTGGIAGAAVYKLLQDAISTWTPQYWQFWIGLLLVMLVMIGRERLFSPLARLWPRRAP